MPEPDLGLIAGAAHEAGEIALRYFRNRPQTWEKSAEAGPVTEADLAVDAMLRERLLAARPDYGWLSEETEDHPARLETGRAFIVDPIDGTRAFIDGQTAWAVSIAVAERGRVVAGIVCLPAQDLVYAAALNEGATVNGTPIRASTRADVAGATVLANRMTFRPEFWPRGVPELKRHFRPSLAWRLALVGEGRFDAMVMLRPAWEWDIAAGSLIAAEAGAKVTDGRGRPLEFNSRHPQSDGVVAAPPALHAGLMALLSPGGG